MRTPNLRLWLVTLAVVAASLIYLGQFYARALPITIVVPREGNAGPMILTTDHQPAWSLREPVPSVVNASGSLVLLARTVFTATRTNGGAVEVVLEESFPGKTLPGVGDDPDRGTDHQRFKHYQPRIVRAL